VATGLKKLNKNRTLRGNVGGSRTLSGCDEMTDLQKLSLLQLLKIGASSPEVRSIVVECRDRGLDVDGTLAEVLRRFAARSACPAPHRDTGPRSDSASAPSEIVRWTRGLSAIALLRLAYEGERSVNRPTSLFLVLAALLSSASAMGQGTLDRIRERGELRIGYRTDARPLSFEENGAPSGYSVDLCKRVAAGIGGQLNLPAMKATYVPVTADNRFDALVKGDIDIECGATTVTLNRMERVDFTLMTFVTGGTFLSKADSRIGSTADLAGKRVAVPRGTSTATALEAHLKENSINARVVTVDDRDAGMAAWYAATSTRSPETRSCCSATRWKRSRQTRTPTSRSPTSFFRMSRTRSWCAATTPTSASWSTASSRRSSATATKRRFTRTGSAATA
jgi:hypothetical protein